MRWNRMDGAPGLCNPTQAKLGWGTRANVEYRESPLHRERATGRQMNMANSTESSRTGKVWFITGASTGFGRLLAEEVLKAGGRVGLGLGARGRGSAGAVGARTAPADTGR